MTVLDFRTWALSLSLGSFSFDDLGTELAPPGEGLGLGGVFFSFSGGFVVLFWVLVGGVLGGGVGWVGRFVGGFWNQLSK